MDNLFGIPLSSILIALTLLVILIFAFLAWIWLRNPLLVRMGLRNVVRRKTQTILIVIGMMLATLIISAAFATGDTVGYSVTNDIYRQFSEADIVLAFDRNKAPDGVADLTDGDVEALAGALAADPDVDGVMGLVQTRVPAINIDDRRAEPLATFAGVDIDSVAALGGLVGLNGEPLDPALLGEDRVYVSERLGEKIGVEAGDRFTIFYENRPYVFVVAGLVRDNAMTANTNAADTSTAGGLVTSLERWREVTGEGDRIDLIGVSAVGGVRDTLDLIEPLEDRINAYIDASDRPMQVIFTKKEFVDFAELIGSIFVTIFLVFGLFSISAGVMLIFLTFVMLAAERRPEMGMARAVGMKRTHLTESFVSEGMAYNLGSALIGALLGLCVAFVLVWVMGRIFDDFGLVISFHVNPQGFLIAYFLGLVITFATVAFSSWRAANLNIVEAIHDLPESARVRASDRSLGRLLRSVVAVAWTLAWIGLVVLWAIAGFSFFSLGLSTYGLGMVAGGLVAGAYVWGLTRVNRPWRSMRWNGRLGYLLWWVGFSFLALVTWLLFRTQAWASRYRTSGGWAIWMLMIGLLATWWGGWPGSQAFAYTTGTTLIMFAIAVLAVFFGARTRPVFTIASLLTLWYWLLPLPFSLFIDDASDFSDPLFQLAKLFGVAPANEVEGNIEMFFVSGIAMTAAATLFVIFNADRLLGLMNLFSRALGGLAPAMRMAISYPLAARVRTGMTLAMFGLVVFSLVVMATLNSNFTQLFLGEDAKGGFDVRVQANESNRIDDLRETLGEAGYEVEGNIDGVGKLVTAFPQMRPANSDVDFETYRVQGVDGEFLDLADFPLTARAIGYESDEAVMAALRTDPTVAIVDESRVREPDAFGSEEGDFELGPRTGELRDAPWEPIPITVRDRETGAIIELHVIGVLEPQVTAVNIAWFAVFVHESVVQDHLSGGETESFFVTTVDRSEQGTIEVASSIEAALLERGVLATSIEEAINDAVAQSSAFQYLFEGFMGLGLIVGIAALGVIAFRTVAERRQQIGMLRAIGYTKRLIAVTFFFESSFIAIAGIAMGLLLGSALSFNLLSSPELIGEEGAEIDFAFPWVRLLIIVSIAYGASALMTLIPARSASSVHVAEALRYE